jgi:Nif-specific regulatory protein
MNDATSPQLQQLVKVGKEILAELEVDRVLTAAMDHLIEISGAERGIIVLFDEHGESLFQTARRLEKKDIEHPQFEISRTIIKKAKAEGQPVYLPNAMEEAALQKSKSVDSLHILSVICLPLVHDEQTFGVIYLDNRTVQGAFKPETFAFVQSFTDFISLAAHHALACRRLHERQQALEEELRSRYDFNAIIGHSPKMLRVLEVISQVADTTAPVLIEGESGAGKELVARAIHYNSQRRSQPMLAVNCAAFPENLLESEFFGHEKGAFTGAFKRHKGMFERADGGTIFLDEIDEMSPALQVKLLRVIQWGEFNPLGGDETKHCDVRIVAASKKALRFLVEAGRFREELYYRLNVIRLEMPPLRERGEDVLLLAEYFLARACKQMQKEIPPWRREAKQALQNYSFPGNVRELENIVSRLAILSHGGAIALEHLPEEVLASRVAAATAETQPLTFKQAKEKAVADFERRYLRQLLEECGGVINKAAQRAGMHSKNFYQKLVKYGIQAQKPKAQ